MTTIATIITDAFRESNLLSIDATPTGSEIAEGLRTISRFIPSLFGTEMGENLQHVTFGSNNVTTADAQSLYVCDIIKNYYVPQNTRLALNLSQATTVYLHPNPKDGARFGVSDVSKNLATYPLTVNGNGRQIEEGNSTTLNVNGISYEWFYRADLGDWLPITDLTTDSDSPFPQEFDDLLVIGLSMRLNPRNATQVDPQSVEEYKRILKSFKSRYRQTTEVSSEMALARFQGRYQLNQGPTADDFKRGRITW